VNTLQSQDRELTRAGRAALEVGLVRGQSTVVSAFATNPLKLLTPRARGQSVWACTSSFGGGLVAGDETLLEVRIRAGARCFVGTQASTKVYRNETGLPCGHETLGFVERDAILVFAPDPVQAFALSIYRQKQVFQLLPGAGLVLVDWFTSGRAARGERWAFSLFQCRNEVFIEDRRVFLDSLLLDCTRTELKGAHRLGRWNCIATVLLAGTPLEEGAQSIQLDVASRAVGKQDALIVSASATEDGVLVRIAGESVEAVGREVQRLLYFVKEILGDDPWARRQ